MVIRRHRDIDLAKGLAILLVVFGHLVARADPANVTWYEPLRRAVYTFHMPFFLYLSGLVAVYSGSFFAPLSTWPKLFNSRSKRLLGPFFCLGSLVVIGKFIASHFIFVDNKPADFMKGLAALVWHTAASPALFIWYLFVLFVVSMAAPLVIQGRPSRLSVLLIITLLLYAAPLPAYLYLDHIGRYAMFFILGACAAKNDARWHKIIDRFWPWLSAIFTGLLGIIACFGASWPPCLTLLPMGILSMPVLHGLVRYLSAKPATVFLFLGRYSFMIYLFNTLFIGLTKGVILHFYSWDGPHFLSVAAALMIAGTLGPITLKKYAFQRVPILDRFTN